MDLVTMLISIVSGAIGGNVAGAAMPDKSLGGIGNTLAGIFGGGAGGSILNALGLFAHAAGATGATGGLDLTAILANIAGSGVGGALVMFLVSMIKNAMNPSK